MATNPANDVLIRAVMTSSTGLVEDQYVNDFTFHDGAGISALQIEALCDNVSDFYRVNQANGLNVGRFISNAVNRGATHELLAYRIAVDGSLNSPVFSEPWLGPLATSTNQGMPTEVAAVLSMHADLTGILEESGATRPRSRRRGRLYLGPLNIDALANTMAPYRLDADFLTTVRQAAVSLMDGSGDRWAVWSRADQTLRPIVGGWTDNAADTQRRRGVTPSTRVTWG